MLYDIQRENVKLKKKIMKEEDEILLLKSQIQKFNKKIQESGSNTKYFNECTRKFCLWPFRT